MNSGDLDIDQKNPEEQAQNQGVFYVSNAAP